MWESIHICVVKKQLFYNVILQYVIVTVICCAKIWWHSYGNVYLFALLFQLSMSFDIISFFPKLVHFWNVCSLLGWCFLSFWWAFLFFQILLNKAGWMGGLMSGTSCFSHLCAFFQRLPIVPGSCSEKHKNIFSLVVQNNTALHCSQKYGETSQKGGWCTWL